MKKTIYIFLLSLLFVACSDEDLLNLSELGNYSEKLVVNGILSTDKQVSFKLTNSESSSNSDLPKLVTNATVNMSVNGNNSVMSYDPGSQSYILSYSPKAGDIFALDVRADGYPFVTSNIQIPNSISANSSLTPNGGLDTSGTPSDLLSISFQDDPAVNNYYKINFFYYNKTLAVFVPMSFVLNDPEISEFNSQRLNDASILFTDEFFNGENKTISTVAPYGLVLSNPSDKYLILLESINEDLYRYYTTLQRARDARESNFISSFNNASVIHTNIQRGLGILGGSYAVRDTLR